jgi:protein phosphatase
MAIAIGMTDTGTVRASNEDNFLVDQEIGLVALADGMGGHDSGEIASAGALLALSQYLRARMGQESAVDLSEFTPAPFDPALADPGTHWTETSLRDMATLHDAVEYTNHRMYEANVARGRGDGDGMGTTLTGLWQPQPGRAQLLFHIGDSRIYRYRRGKLDQLTRDQTVYQLAIEAGEKFNLPSRNLLLQALGPAPVVEPELRVLDPEPGDLYLLCSDGMYGATDDARMAVVLKRTNYENIETSCAQLIKMAKGDGSRDNITVLLIQCDH